MRILVLDTYYPDFVSEVYSSRTDLQARSYAEQHKILIDRCFGTSDAYSSNLRALGYEADEIIVDCAPLQEMWAEENLEGMRKQGRIGLPGRIGGARATLARLRRIALAQIEAYEPSVLYCQNLDFLTRAQLDSLRRRGIFVVGQIASPAPSDRQLRGFDLILSSFPHFVRRFREMGIDSQEFGLAFDSRIIGRLRDEGISSDPGASRDHSVVFVGGVNPRVHAAGTELLERLCRLFPVSVWGYGVDELPPSSAIRRCHHGEAWGLDMYKVLANAKVALNRHIDVADGFANNMRMYEATGMGAALVTNSAPNLNQLFEVGTEVVAYDDEVSLVSSIESLLEDETRRVTIAAAGQRRTLSDHDFADRMRELVSILNERLNPSGRLEPRGA